MTEVTLLTQIDCTWCDDAQQILTDLAIEFAITVRKIPLESAEGRRLATDNAVLFAPGVLLDGQLFSQGRLSKKKLRGRLVQVQPTNLQRSL